MRRTRRQALGQHFLANRGVVRKIVGVIDPGPNDLIVEIGAGKGVLTWALAERGAEVVALEKDPALAGFLSSQAPSNVRVLQADALAVDFRSLLPPGWTGPAKCAGNLPYSISSPLLFKFLEAADLFSLGVFLLQKEVADRVCSGPGSKDYAPVSVLIQNRYAARAEFTVSAGSFAPPPRVMSSLVSLRRRPAPLFPAVDCPGFRNFLRAAFAQRRKRLWKNLEKHYPSGKLAEAFGELGLAPNTRAEELSPETLVRLFRFSVLARG